MSFSPSNRARTASASQFSGRRRSFMKRAYWPPRLGRSPVARSTPWLSTCTRTWSLRNPGSAISTTSCASPACFHSTSGSKSSNARVLLRRRSMVDGLLYRVPYICPRMGRESTCHQAKISACRYLAWCRCTAAVME
jgi:hypothetical protein